MNQTQELLQSVVENARTGADACEQLLKHAKDADMRDKLMRVRDRYEQFAHEAEQALYDSGEHPHAKNPISRAGMWVGLQMNTLLDSSSEHISDILVQGAAMGIVGMTRDRNNLSDADPSAQALADRFIAAQQSTINTSAGCARTQ